MVEFALWNVSGRCCEVLFVNGPFSVLVQVQRDFYHPGFTADTFFPRFSVTTDKDSRGSVTLEIKFQSEGRSVIRAGLLMDVG